MDADPAVRSSVVAALGRIRDPAAAVPLMACLSDPDANVRTGAAMVLGKLGDLRAIDFLARMIMDPIPEVREAAESARLRIRKRHR